MQHFDKIPKIAKAQNLTPTNPLLKGMHVSSSYGQTDNGALTFIRSGSALLDFYAQAGAMRNAPEAALDLFQKAFAEDREKALRVLFYLRDVRGGQGERKLFRSCMEWLGTDFPAIFEQMVDFIPEYGRWDDVLFNNPACFALIKKQLEIDQDNDMPSLLAKWLPTINASSPTTRAKATTLATALGYKPVDYRRLIRSLRKKIKTVEELMSAQKWGEVNYSGVPSQAARIYKKAFAKHDETRYAEFIDKATKGEVKIQSGTLYPYQIYKDVQSEYVPALEALWNQLPDYTMGKNALVITDVSGSMTEPAMTPISVSVSLALYFAERNRGPFKDHFITFSAKPMLQRIQGKTLREKMHSIEQSEWGMNTDLEAAFRLILNTAIANKVSAEDMPDTLYIISDMQFDSCVQGVTPHQDLKDKYAAAGYDLPTVVFWNVNAKGGNLPVRQDERGVAMVSGFSPVIFKMAVENKSPEEVMLDTINSERYARIKL